MKPKQTVLPPSSLVRRQAGPLAALAVLVALFWVAVSPVPAAEEPTHAWQPLFKGIDTLSLTQETPEPLSAYAVRIDLKDPDVRFFVTPQNGEHDRETDGLKTTTFLKKYGCQVAINASPYSPEGETEGEPRDVLGLSVSEGDVYSPAHGEWGALLITKDNKARIETPPFDTADVYNAVGGFHLLLKGGENVGTIGEKHPRTAVGLSQDKRYLYLLVIDGRQPGYSLGASTSDTAAMLRALGAYEALNLDGGGSTTLVFDAGNGDAKVVNRPIHQHLPGNERVSANHLGIFAKPLQEK